MNLTSRARTARGRQASWLSSLLRLFDAWREHWHTADVLETRTENAIVAQRLAPARDADEASTPWIVCHRHFDHGHAGLSAFSSPERAYLHAARLIRDELQALLELDEDNGRELAQALRDGRYETAVRLYHEIEGNLDAIDVTRLELDQFHRDDPLEVREVD